MYLYNMILALTFCTGSSGIHYHNVTINIVGKEVDLSIFFGKQMNDFTLPIKYINY
jgi:hypothetical protein